MKLPVAAYRKVLAKQISSFGWIRCFIWSAVKSILEGVSYYFELDHLLIRIGLGFIWIGISAAALTMFLATLRLKKVFKTEKRLRIWLIVQITSGILLMTQPLFLIFGLFWLDGLLTVVSALGFTVSGYKTAMILEYAKLAPEESTGSNSKKLF